MRKLCDQDITMLRVLEGNAGDISHGVVGFLSSIVKESMSEKAVVFNCARHLESILMRLETIISYKGDLQLLHSELKEECEKLNNA